MNTKTNIALRLIDALLAIAALFFVLASAAGVALALMI